MTLPHRDFFNYIVRTLVGHSTDNSFDDIWDFTNDHIELNRIGHYYEVFAAPGSFYKWFTLTKSPSAELLDGMDQALDYGMNVVLTIDNNNNQCAQFQLYSNTCRYPDGGTWDKDLVTGKYYDGVNAWGDYPQSGAYQGVQSPTLNYADRPYSLFLWIPSYQAGPWGNSWADYFCRNGMEFSIQNWANCDHVWGTGDIIDGYIQILSSRINFLNPVVNSVSHPWIKYGTTPIFTLYGLAFNQDNAELNSTDRSPYNSVGLNWDSIIDYIDIIGQQGQGTITLSRALGDFVVDSDYQIRITNFPLLAIGTYHILLKKNGVCPPSPINVEAYAGDWKADSDGLVTQSTRLAIVVEDEPTKKKGPILFSKWAFKKGDLTIFQYWAPIDVRSNERFYEGRLLSESGYTRSIDDRTGLPNISDMSVDVAIDQELRQLLAEYFVKNQLVELYFGWNGEPESWKQQTMVMVVDDHDIEGNVWKVTLKDISQKYFRVSIPQYLITLDEYPNAIESAIGQPMPEAIGLCSKTSDPPGAIEAFCIDTTTFKYLALRASAHAILEVYSNGVLQTEGAGNDYTISYEDGGRTYINFNNDQAENKITFNCEGYMLGAWDSANGYVQNPAYVFGFIFALLAGVPAEFLDLTALDEVAAHFEDYGWDESGFWIGQTDQTFESVIQELGFTYGIKTWPDSHGRFTFGIKDITNYQTDIWIFEQIDALAKSVRKENLRDAINYVKAQYCFIPTSSAYLGAFETTRESSIEDFGARIEASDSPWKFPWTTSESLAKTRANNELLKHSYGLKEIEFSLAIDWIFNIDIFDSFIYQNPFAPTLTGNGEQQRYYYIKSISYDYVANTLKVIGIDLHYLLRQCMIIGVCADMAENWNDATDAMKLFGYILPCDDEDVKKICPC